MGETCGSREGILYRRTEIMCSQKIEYTLRHKGKAFSHHNTPRPNVSLPTSMLKNSSKVSGNFDEIKMALNFPVSELRSILHSELSGNKIRDVL